MELEIAQEITQNKTNDKIYKLSCKKCDGKTNHKVLSSVENHWAEEDLIEGYDRFEIASCCGCGEISFRFSSTNSENIICDGETGEIEYVEEEELYPNRVVGRRQVNETYFLPDLVLRIYRETHGALSGKFNILASIGIRALVEAICKNCNAVGINLENKINNLVTIGVLTKTNADVLHETRILGNRAVHEMTAPNPEDLNIAMDIVESLLKTVYIIPEKAKRLRKK